MAISELITMGLGALKEGLKLANTPLAEKQLKKVLDCEEKLAAAENIPYDEQSDAEISRLYREYKRLYRGAILAIQTGRGAT